MKPTIKEECEINNPGHYNQGEIECIDAIESATLYKSGLEAVCVANVIKYLWRYEQKGGIKDVKKARWYLDRLISKLEEFEDDYIEQSNEQIKF